VPSEEPAFRLAGVELVKVAAPVPHIARFLPIVRLSSDAFHFVLCFMLPYKTRFLQLALVFATDSEPVRLSAELGGEGGGAERATLEGGQDATLTAWHLSAQPPLSPFEANMARHAPLPAMVARCRSSVHRNVSVAGCSDAAVVALQPGDPLPQSWQPLYHRGERFASSPKQSLVCQVCLLGMRASNSRKVPRHVQPCSALCCLAQGYYLMKQ
jgi:hypothetical protein